MKALVFHKPKDIRYETVPDPKIEHVRDAIVRVTSTSICGSDLHIYNGYIPQPRSMVLGHEFMGVVEEVGPRVSNLKKGDRVVVPFQIACGQCVFCKKGLTTHCEKSNPDHYGPDGTLTQKGGALFGYTDLYGPYQGGQAEYVRVPYADFGPRKVPEGVTDEQALFLSDIIPTGWTGADWCELEGGETVAVFGCGPVGIMALRAAKLIGAERIIGIDILDYRLAFAKKLTGCETINQDREEVVERLRAMTKGYGPDACIDCVGMEAELGWLESAGNAVKLQVGTTKVLQAAMRGVRRGGAVSVIGVYALDYTFPLGQLFDKGLLMRGGQALVQPVMDQLLGYVQEGKLRADDVITHRMPLSDGAEAYRLFNAKEDGVVKIVLKP